MSVSCVSKVNEVALFSDEIEPVALRAVPGADFAGFTLDAEAPRVELAEDGDVHRGGADPDVVLQEAAACHLAAAVAAGGTGTVFHGTAQRSRAAGSGEVHGCVGFCSDRETMVPMHWHRAEDRPSKSACEVSCRAGPWKWTGQRLPAFLRPALRHATQGVWVPRATTQEGAMTSAAVPFTHGACLLSKLPLRRE